MNISNAQKAAIALVAVYVIWGSTYLAIRYGVAITPPYLFASSRFWVSGLLMLAFARWRRLPMPKTVREFRVIALTGVLMLGGANGLVTWAEQWVDSNQAALMVATSALWMAGMGSVGRQGEPLSALTWVGLGLGLAGVAFLVGEGIGAATAPIEAYAGLVVSPILWAAGSIYSRRNPVSCSFIVTAAWQMLVAAALMAGIGVALGEPERWRWTLQSWAALAYLAILGSCVAYAAYFWLVGNVTPAVLGTYAYVNPAVAVLLGWWLAGEQLGVLQWVGTGIILLGVLLVTLAQGLAKRSKRAELPTEQT